MDAIIRLTKSSLLMNRKELCFVKPLSHFWNDKHGNLSLKFCLSSSRQLYHINFKDPAEDFLNFFLKTYLNAF